MSKMIENDVYGQAVISVSAAYDCQLKPLGDLALATLAARSGEHIVDIGCGAAQTCLQLAETVGTEGAVLGLDLSPALVEFAAKRASGLPQIEVINADVGAFAFAPHTYDGLFSRFGVMSFADPVASFSNLRSGLKPKGRLAFVCWRAFGENELDHLPFNAALSHLPSDDTRHIEQAYPFSFADIDHVKTVLRESGFEDIEGTPHDLGVSAGDLESTLNLCLGVGALGAILRRKPELRDVVIEPVRKALEERNSAQGLFMNAAVWVVTANNS